MSNLTGGCQKLQKAIVTIELSAFDLCRIQSFIKIEAFAVLRPNLCHKKLLSPLNLASLICAEYKISPNWSSWNSSLKIWPKRWKIPKLRSVKFDSRQESQKTFVPIEFVTLSLFRVQSFIKIEAFAIHGP